MNILKSVKKIPGGLMVVPLLLGAIINTFFGGTIWTMFDGTFTTYLWKSGAMPILAVFIFCNATTINFKKAGVTVYKGVVITAVKVGVGIIIGLICGKLFGEAGFLGLSTLAIVGALANSNGGLYAALAGEYGDATDVGAVSILSINDGPFFTMVALGAAGVAKIPMSVLVGCIIPVILRTRCFYADPILRIPSGRWLKYHEPDQGRCSWNPLRCWLYSYHRFCRISCIQAVKDGSSGSWRCYRYNRRKRSSNSCIRSSCRCNLTCSI